MPQVRCRCCRVNFATRVLLLFPHGLADSADLQRLPSQPNLEQHNYKIVKLQVRSRTTHGRPPLVKPTVRAAHAHQRPGHGGSRLQTERLLHESQYGLCCRL